MRVWLGISLVLLGGCDPYGRWPDEPDQAYPWGVPAEVELEAYEAVRWETESWDPSEDLAMSAQYLLKAQNHRPGAPDEVVEHFEVMKQELPRLQPGIQLSFVGDVMWVGGNWGAFLDPVAPLLDGDLRLGNLETPTSPEHPTELGELGLYAFNAPVQMLDGLPLDVVQINNNHTLDADDAGAVATRDELESRGMTPVGLDTHATVTVEGQEVAVLTWTWGVNRRDYASEHELFVLPFGHIDQDIDLSPLEAEVSAARASADTMIVMLHWGFEYEYYPDVHFQKLARAVVAAGADVVVGQGPHVVQPAELCHVNQPEFVPGVGVCSLRTPDEQPRDALVLYSLGNFGTIMPTLPCQMGIVATVSVDPDVSGVAWQAVVSVDDPEPVVVPALDVEEPAVQLEWQRLSAHIGDRWRRDAPAQ